MKLVIRTLPILMLPMLLACQSVVDSLMPEKARVVPDQTGLPEAAWNMPATLSLRLAKDRGRTERAWHYVYGADGELLISPEGATVHGRILLLDDRTLLVEKEVIDRINPVGTVDRPALDQALVLRLLELAWPYHPLSIRRQERVSLLSVDKAMLISAGSDEESYIGPWDLNGRLRRRDPWTVEFDLRFRYPHLDTRKSVTRHLQGHWQGGERRALDPAMSLAGWAVYQFVPSTRMSAGITIASFQAERESVSFNTLAEARDYARWRR